MTNTHFKKRLTHLVTYQSGPYCSQVDYILIRKKHLKLVKDTKVIPGEECVPQHNLLVSTLILRPTNVKPRPFVPKRRIWKLKDPSVSFEFEEKFKELVNGYSTDNDDPDGKWNFLRDALLKVTDKVCGWTKKKNWKEQTWWWNESVNELIKDKRTKWKEWKSGGSKEQYLDAKRRAKRAVYIAKKSAEPKLTQTGSDIFKIAKHWKGLNRDVVGETCVRDDNGNIAFGEEALKTAWRSYHSRLLNHENDWNVNSLSEAPSVSGPPITVTAIMVASAISCMKIGIAVGPSGIAIEMIKASGSVGAQMIADLANSIIKAGQIPKQWEESFIINVYKGKGDAMERGNYRGLKLLDHALKVIERVVVKIVRKHVNIDDMQFGFMPGRGTTDAIFILRQLQEKYISKDKQLFFAFVDLEKAFDRVPREVIWWSLRKLGVEEWLVKLVQAMYANARSQVRVGDEYSEMFEVGVGVHQGSVLSPLLFIIVLEALSRSFKSGCPYELLYADDLAIIAPTKEELFLRLKQWKNGMESKGLRVNMKKTKIMISGSNFGTLKDSGRFPCAVCRSGVGKNSILCHGCSHWVHKKCTGIVGRLVDVPSFRCGRCLGTARPIDARPCHSMPLDGQELEVVDSFCYLGDMTDAGGGCTRSVINRTRVAWGKFHDLLPILTCRTLSFYTRGYLYATCVRSAMLHAMECLALTATDINKLQTTDRAMIRWICGVKIKALLSKLKIPCMVEVCRLNTVD